MNPDNKDLFYNSGLERNDQDENELNQQQHASQDQLGSLGQDLPYDHEFGNTFIFDYDVPENECHFLEDM